MPTDFELKPTKVDPYQLRQDRPSDENLSEFAENLRNEYGNNLVVLLGSGAFVGTTVDGDPLPTATGLRNELWRKFFLGNESGFDFGNLGLMSLDQAAAFAESKVGRTPVARYLADRFRTTRTLWQHAVLPFLKPKALFTTNYDLLLENAWAVQTTSSGISPIVSIFSSRQKVLLGYTPLYKPHGSAERALDPIKSGGPVITTIDYFKMVTDKQRMLDKWLANSRCAAVLMIGHSMTDMDIGARLYDIKRNIGGLHWYAAFPRSDSTVRKYWSEQLRIRPIDRRFVELMVDLDKLLDFIPRKWKYETISEHQERGIIA